MSPQSNNILLISLCSFLGFGCDQNSDINRSIQLDIPRVETDKGWIEGYTMKTKNGKTVFGFSGVPYAKPPVGNLRFRDPEPPEPWQDIRDTKKFGNACPQLLVFVPPIMNSNTGNEDCLYLSVYSPNLKGNYPVLVYYHGGAFLLGVGEISHNPSRFIDEDIVVVTSNYRLGPLGFLSLEDEILPGNMGLKDQNMVLQWVRNNIAQFGGDPRKVTLIGESAGGASVVFHLKSPMSRGLISGGISCSGTALSFWAYTQPGVARRRAQRVAKILGCPTENSQKIVDCLRTKTPYELVNTHKKFLTFLRDPTIVFAPVIDIFSSNPFLPDDPWFLPTAPVPYMTGLSKYDDFVIWPNNYETFDKNFNTLLPVSVHFDTLAEIPSLIANQIRNFYFGDNRINSDQLEALTNIYTDAWFFYPMSIGLQNHTADRYFYYMDYLGENSFGDIFCNKRVVNSSSHTDLSIYLWTMDYIFRPLQGKDLTFARAVTHVFSNFIKYGNPSPPGSKVIWDPWEPQEEKYLHITNDGFIQERHLLPDRAKFWQNLGARDLIARQRYYGT